MGIQPFMICATVEAILAQRLVRRICPKCREEVRVSADLLFELGMERDQLEGRKFYRGTGCDACNNTGYKGRVGLFELMVLNDLIRDMVMANASTDEIRTQAQKDGMITLREFGMGLASNGITSLEEVVRETIEEG
jgi:type IV pilus assembly protein PilB